jgi:prevent-host-death family protein
VVKKASAAQAKSQFSALMAEVAHGGKRVVIERHGKPLAALVSVSDLERLEEGLTARPQGAMALVGATNRSWMPSSAASTKRACRTPADRCR